MTTPDRRTAQERGIKMGNRVIEEFHPRVNQLISATIHVAGEQDLRIDTHGSHADRGGHIAVASDNLLIYLHDQKSAKVYADAWIDAWYIASHLPKKVATEPRAETGPVMMVRAYGSDTVRHVHDTARDIAVIRIGRLAWMLHDQAAWTSAAATWRNVADIAPVVLAPHNTDRLPHRDGHRTRPAEPAVQPITLEGSTCDGPRTPNLSTFVGSHPHSPTVACGHEPLKRR